MVACPLIKDLVEKFGGESEAFDGNEASILNATFYFSHSEAVLPFLRLLDLYRLKGPKLRTDYLANSFSY